MATVMRIGLLAVLVLSVSAVSLVAAAAPADEPAGQSENASLPGEWRTLSLEDSRINRSDTTTVSSDLGAVLARRGDEVQTQHRGATLSKRTDDISTDSAKFDLLDEELRRIDGQIDRLRATERRAIRAYDSGRIGATALVVRLARIRALGAARQQQLNDIRTAGQRIDARAIVAKSNARSTRLSTTDGPVRDQVGRTTAASGSPRRITVLSAGEGVAITSVSGEQYRREVSVPSRMNGSGTAIQLPEAIDIVAKSYPEAYSNRQRIDNTIGGRRAGLFRITVVGDGELRAFVGIRSRQVYQEARRVPLRSLRGQASPGSSTTNDGIRLTAYRTYRGGPLLLRTEEAGADVPVNATVFIDGTRVGVTGSDGERWSVAPGGRTNVTVRADGATAGIHVTPEAPPPLNRTVE